jgi:hypothetical protein
MSDKTDISGMSELAERGAHCMMQMFADCQKVERGMFAASERLKDSLEEMTEILTKLRIKNGEFRRQVRERKRYGAKNNSDTSLNEFNV